MLRPKYMPSPNNVAAATPARLGYAMPAEWEPHAATWLGWPHNATDWPGKFEVIPWVYGEMVRKISTGENIRLIIRHQQDEQFARHVFKKVGVDLRKIKFVMHPTNRGWTRDTGPIFVTKQIGRDGSPSRPRTSQRDVPTYGSSAFRSDFARAALSSERFARLVTKRMRADPE